MSRLVSSLAPPICTIAENLRVSAPQQRALSCRWVRWGAMLSFVGLFATAMSSAPANEASAGAGFFGAPAVWRIQIELTPGNLDSLSVESRKYIPANVRARGEFFRDVGVHLKGSTGSFRSIDNKPSLTLDFERFNRGQRFRGLQKIHLNNSVEDATYLKEQLGSELFCAAQVPVPRVAHALVELNGRQLGLYVLKEGFTEDFIGRHFERADGNLYDNQEGHDVNLPLKRHLGSGATGDQAGLQRLTAAAVEPDLARRWERLRQILDRDRFLSFMAMEMMICHWDGYCLGRNNFRLYHDPGTDRIVFLPSGMDQLFAKADLPWKPDMAGLVARAVMQVPEGRQQYAARFESLFDALFVSERLTNRVNQLVAELRPFLTNTDYNKIHREAAGLCRQIQEREINLRTQLDGPEPAFPEFHHEVASLAGWKPVDEPARGRLQETNSPDGKAALRIVADSTTAASWRTTIRLHRGSYRIQGAVQVMGVLPLPFGKHHGASLRVAAKDQRSANLVGTGAWRSLATQFEISVPEEEIVIICELRAQAGEAWFDKSSLVLIRLPEGQALAVSREN